MRDVLDILTDDLAVTAGQTLQPLTGSTGWQGVEEGGQAFQACFS
jgi:hypothetical protein